MFILTVRNDRLGDLVLALPTLGALRRRYPDARLGVVCSSYAAPLLDLYPDPLELWPDTEEQRGRLAHDRPDAMLFLYPDRAWARAAWKARVPLRVGTRRRRHAWRFNRRVNVSRRRNARHEADYNLLLAEPLLPPSSLRPVRLVVPPAAQERADELLRGCGLTPEKDFVAVHPGSSGSARSWPPAHFRDLVGRLTGTGRPVVVTGGPTESALAAEVSAPSGSSLAGGTDLATLAGVLARARVLVAGSTGPLHLAAALGTPVVGIYSPLAGHTPRRWGPLGRAHRVLLPPDDVDGDASEPMAGLHPETVAAAVLRALGEGRA